MHDLPREKLVEIVARYGDTVVESSRRCRGLLLDHCGEHRREINLLIVAQEERIPADLRARQSGVPLEVLLGRSIKRLMDNYAMAEDAARWAVESWALALVVAVPDQLAGAPAPPPVAVQRPPVQTDAGVTHPPREPKRYEILSPDRIIWGKDGKEMVRIPAGEFLYGDRKEGRELPECWIDRTPVTNAEYARFVAVTDHNPPQHWKGKAPLDDIADHPVTYVSWHDAVAYTRWAGKRLPTDEEWERAARGTDGREYPWGDWEEGRCNTEEADIRGTTPVGEYSPPGDSPCGCVDMAGNVWEWTTLVRRRRSADVVLRGGSWSGDRRGARCAGRYDFRPSYFSDDIGFRAVFPGSLPSDS